MSLAARIAAALAVVLALVAGVWRVHATADAAGYARAVGEQAQYDLAASEAARTREAQAATTLKTITRKATDENDDLRRRAAALADSLHDRPPRPSEPTAQGPADPVACTGAGLYRADGEFLAGEAARANRLRADLAFCQAAYDTAVRLTAD